MAEASPSSRTKFASSLTSQHSTEEIEHILETIRTKTTQAAEQVILRPADRCVEVAMPPKKVTEVMRTLSGDSNKVEQQSAQVERAADDLRHQYTKITDQIVTIAGTTEQNIASIQEMSASMTTQDTRIIDIVESFLQLDKLAGDLKKMTQE